MPLKKLIFKSGVNRENTRYTSENGWYECDKIRFRQGTPEKIGGWDKFVPQVYNGVCRSLFAWVTLTSKKLVAIGTSSKYYVAFSGVLYDVTPLRRTATLTNPFSTSNTSPIVTVSDTAHGCTTGDYVTYSGASTVGGLNLNNEYVVTVLTVNAYTITASSPATSTVANPPGGGGTVTAKYQINAGYAIQQPFYGWGSGFWGQAGWGLSPSTGTVQQLRLWSQFNFGEDLLFGYRGSGIYIFYGAGPGGTLANRGVLISSLVGASDVPSIQNYITISDSSRFTFAFGCNDYGSAVLNPMLIRWSDQEDYLNWTPAPTNQAGSLQLSHGSEIITIIQARQEILVWTDAAIYSLQYVGAPIVWGSTLLADSISIISPQAATYTSGVTYWMGVDKFYKYDGTVSTLSCDLRRYVFSDINQDQGYQVISGSNEGYNEVWWFYPSADSSEVNKYVVYNYLENVWYYGTMPRTAWLDSSVFPKPIAADSTVNLIVSHETGVDNNSGITAQPIEAYISSAEFDIEDGDHFGFVYRIVPDVTFLGSTVDAPSATMTLIPMKNSGSGFSTSVGGTDQATITRTATVPIEQFTGQIFVRVRGRQMILRMASTGLGVAWQLGAPRIDIRQDGRR
jgi:hypothetical protein